MIVTLAELAAVPGMPSEPTLRKMIAENADFPILSRGKNGVAYEFDLESAIGFVRGLREKEEEAARARAEQVRQLGLNLLGADAVASPDRAGLSAAERKALLEEELVAMKVAERRGELVRKVGVEAMVAAVLALVTQQRRSFAGRLVKRADLTRAQIGAIEELGEQDLRELADKFEELGQEVAGVSQSGEDTLL